MLLPAKLLSTAVMFALAGGGLVPDRRPPFAWNWPGRAVRAVLSTGHGRSCPPLRAQEPPDWLKAFAIAALLLALSALGLAAALL